MEYQALQLVSSLEHYGVEWHWVRDANGQRLAIGVGPEGIAICKEDFSLVNRYAPCLKWLCVFLKGHYVVLDVKIQPRIVIFTILMG